VTRAGLGRPTFYDWADMALLAGVFIASFVTPALTQDGHPNAPGMGFFRTYLWGLCPLRHLTGIPCPMCGLTRGFIQLAHGHLVEAIALNPLTPAFFVLFAIRFLKDGVLCFSRREVAFRVSWAVTWRFYEVLLAIGALTFAWRVIAHFAGIPVEAAV
jgi:Protein of unknown function (DUF2752)